MCASWETPVHLYAAVDFLDRRGRPGSMDDLANFDFIGFDQTDRLISRLNGLGLPLTKENFKLSSENGTVAWELVRQGFGIGVMVEEIADRTPGIERVLPDIDLVDIPVWLVTHRELHTSRRIRLVFDILAEALH